MKPSTRLCERRHDVEMQIPQAHVARSNNSLSHWQGLEFGTGTKRIFGMFVPIRNGFIGSKRCKSLSIRLPN
jgi:hypothetical protein